VAYLDQATIFRGTADLRSTSSRMTDATIPVEFITPEGARTFANYLRSTIKIRQGVLFEKRVDYFKG
jgi:hypothetical protein